MIHMNYLNLKFKDEYFAILTAISICGVYFFHQNIDTFWMNKEKLTRAGFEPATYRIDVPGLYQLS